MAVRINLDGAVRYINALPVSKLDGLALELNGKLTELGLTWNRRQRIAPNLLPGGEPTGNLAGVIRFVKSIGAGSTPADVEALQTLAAVVFGRTAAAGYQLPNPE